MLSIPLDIDAWLDAKLSHRLIPGYTRGPYQHHKDNLEQLDAVFAILLNHPNVTGFMEKLAAKTNICRSTLSTWRFHLIADRNWRPRRCNYAYAQRIFTDEQEAELATRIATNYLDKGLFYSDADFKIDALRYFDEVTYGGRQGPLTAEEMKEISQFTASHSFTSAFRYRNRLSLRRPSFKRRPKATPEDMDRFIEEVRGIMRTYPLDRIINIDETNWKAVPGAFMTWAHKGVESVQCQIDNDDKQGVTVIAAVDASGTKLPLTVIGKGKTPRCLAGYQLPLDVHTCVSESGWTTNDVMCGYFGMLRRELFPEGPLVVILDTYSAHRSREVREVARLWEIELVFIPPGCTDKLQPLDRRVFGVLKAYARQLWREQYHASLGGKTTRPMMAANLCEAWRRITEGLVQEAWRLYHEEPAWKDLIVEERDAEWQETLDALTIAESFIH